MFLLVCSLHKKKKKKSRQASKQAVIYCLLEVSSFIEKSWSNPIPVERLQNNTVLLLLLFFSHKPLLPDKSLISWHSRELKTCFWATTYIQRKLTSSLLYKATTTNFKPGDSCHCWESRKIPLILHFFFSPSPVKAKGKDKKFPLLTRITNPEVNRNSCQRFIIYW